MDNVTRRLVIVERVGLLRGVDFFGGVPGHVLAEIAEAASEIELGDGQVLIEQGDEGDALYVVASGHLAIDRGTRRIDELEPGSVVGEFAALVPEPRSATVSALEPALVLEVRKTVLDELLLDHPEIAVGVIRSLVTRFRHQLVTTDAGEAG